MPLKSLCIEYIAKKNKPRVPHQKIIPPILVPPYLCWCKDIFLCLFDCECVCWLLPRNPQAKLVERKPIHTNNYVIPSFRMKVGRSTELTFNRCSPCNFKEMTDQQIDQQTAMSVHKEVKLPIKVLFYYWKWNFPMTRSVRLSCGRSVCLS